MTYFSAVRRDSTSCQSTQSGCVDTTWTDTGVRNTATGRNIKVEVSNCGTQRYVDLGPVHAASQRLCCGDVPGFGYSAADPKDPAATVEIGGCTGMSESVWIYPTAGFGHTVEVLDCNGGIVGYAVNVSTTAPDCGCKG